MRTLLIAMVGLVVGLPAVAGAQDDIMINNGLAPPNPENVIDAADDYSSNDDVYVRNVGCPPGWPSGNPRDPCPSPGGPTEVEFASEGYVDGYVYALESSSITMNGGAVDATLDARDSSTVTMNHGSSAGHLNASDFSTIVMNGGDIGGLYVGGFSTLVMNGGWVSPQWQAYGSSTITLNGGVIVALEAQIGGSSTVTISGGAIEGRITATESSTVRLIDGWVRNSFRAEGDSLITIVGNDFEVNGLPVPYGDLEALVGHLTGTLASGHSVDNTFRQGGFDYTGTITLEEYVPEPNASLLAACALVTLALLRRRAA